MSRPAGESVDADRRSAASGLAGTLRRFWPGRGGPLPTAPPLIDETLLRALERLALAAGSRQPRRIAGNRRSPQRAPAAEFVEHRPYSPGDDLRRLDWHAQARLGAFVIRLGEQPASGLIRLAIDCSPSMRFGDPDKLRRACQVAAAIGYVALCQFDRVTIEPLGATLAVDPLAAPVLQGKLQAHRLFARLTRLAAGPSAESASAADLERRFADRVAGYRSGDQVLLISDLLAPGGYRQGLAALRSRGLDARVLHVLAPEELRPAVAGDRELRDPETGERRQLTLDAATLRRYDDRLTAWLTDQSAYCAARGLPYARIDTAEALERVLLDGLRSAGVVA